MTDTITNEKECFRSGQIVSIRNRLWRIDSIYKNQLTATTIDSFTNFQKTFYIPFETIEHSKISMPDITKLGDLTKQDLLHTAYKMNLIHGSSPLLSLQRASVIPTNYQLVPVIMSLNNIRTRLLIADDVGLGKTIEAGLIATELIARQLVKKILVVCPSNLREQWQEALKQFFKLDFNIISSLHIKYLEKELPVGLSPWEYFPRLITSVDYAKSKAIRNEILNYDWDLIIVDEAHLCARPHLTQYNSSSVMQRWEFLRLVSKKTKHLILTTATPHSGYTDSFASLLDVLDINATDKNDLSFIDKSVAKNHVCQRRRLDVEKWIKEKGDEFNPFPESEKKEVHIEKLSNQEVKVYNKLVSYGDSMMKLLKDDHSRYLNQFVIIHFMKRTLSSPYALRKSLENRIKRILQGETDAEINTDDAKSSITETDLFETMTAEETIHRIERSIISIDTIEAELSLLKDLYEESKKISASKDSKFNKLCNDTIPELFKNNSKIIIFTRYKDTLDYLANNLKNHFNDTKIIFIHGQMNNEKRKEVFIEFELANKSILIATDCISEGINLQYLCSQIIHYELPWNPNRLEQRNGRVDRFGQPEKVHIRTMIVDNTLDEHILKRIIERADSIKAEFGFSPPFFNDENAILKQLMVSKIVPQKQKKSIKEKYKLNLFDLLEENQTNENIKITAHNQMNPNNQTSENIKITAHNQMNANNQTNENIKITAHNQMNSNNQTSENIKIIAYNQMNSNNQTSENIKITAHNSENNIEDSQKIKQQLDKIKSESFYGQTDISLPDVERKLRETEKTLGSPQEIECFIKNGLMFYNSTITKNKDKTYSIIINDKKLLVAGMNNKIIKATFNKDFAAKHPESELIDLSHPLVTRLVNIIKQEFHSDINNYGRTAIKISKSITEIICVFNVLIRFVVDTVPSSIIEEIISFGFEIYSGKLVSQENLIEFQKSKPCPGSRLPSEFQENINDFFESNDWESKIANKIESIRLNIINERKRLLETLKYEGDLPDWVKGITDVNFASYDVISITAGYPFD